MWRHALQMAACVGLTCWAGPAAAAGTDACVQEIEPNDQLDQASQLVGATCAEGSIDSGDQDRFVWTIPPQDGASGWQMRLEAGYPHSKLALRPILPGSDGQPETEGPEMLSLDIADGAYSGQSEQFLLSPGRYLIDVLSSGAGPYRMSLVPSIPAASEAEPNDTPEQATPLPPGVTIAGTLLDQPDLYAFALSAAEARRHWTLTVNGSLGQWMSAELLDGTGTTLLTAGNTMTRPLEIADLGLTEGTYYVRFAPTSSSSVPYTIALAPSGPRVPTREDEPNDSPATAASLVMGRTVVGRLGRGSDVDVFRLDFGSELADKRVSMTLKSAVARSLCLSDSAGRELQCRNGDRPELADIALPTGQYNLTVSGGADPDHPYELTVRIAGPRVPGAETEPNDRFENAMEIAAETPLGGRLSGADIDYFALHIEGPSQLWTISATGTGVEAVAVTDSQQNELGSGENVPGGDGASARDVFLLPGDYHIRVSGRDGAYVLTTMPMGAPDPSAEREPNDTADEAQRLDFGVPRTGRLSDSSDRDVYRFSLFAPDHLRLVVTPAAGDAIGVVLEWGYPSPRRPQGSTTDKPYVYDALLDPGDYIVRLTSETRSSSPYRIALDRADPFDLPDDLEPNDSPAQARALPASHVAAGTVTANMDEDWYALPPLDRPTRVHVQITGEITAELVDGREGLPGTWDSATNTVSADLPVSAALRLGIRGDGPYALAVSFDDGPAPRPEALPLSVSLTLALDQPRVAAFWIRGQRLPGTIGLTNTGTKTQTLRLDVRSSHFAYRPELASDVVTLAPGQRTDIPFAIVVAPDAWSNQRIDIAARITGEDGAEATAATSLTADQDVVADNQVTAFPLPNALLGGFNVASAALGGTISLPEGDGRNERPQVLQDGLVGDARIGAFAISASDLPFVLTSRFGTDRPWTIAGITIHPQAEGRLYPAEQLNAFELLLSEDGLSFTHALTGALSLLPIEQAFVLDAPVSARAAQLRLISNHADNIGNVGLSEWKVIAVPGEPDGLSADIAEWRRGGHVVWNSEVVGSGPEDERAMLGEARSVAVKIAANRTPQWVIGFHENRAARIASFEWIEGDTLPDQHRFSALGLALSTDGPFGPWRDLPGWTLAPDRDGLSRLVLPQPVWARFVRFTARDPQLSDGVWVYPKALRIKEQPTGQAYLSILGEWGQYNSHAIFEALAEIPAPVPPPVASTAKDRPGSNRQDAQGLLPGVMVAGEVRLNEIEDWYEIDIPEGMNRLELSATGEPVVTVDLDLETSDEMPVPLRQLPSSARQLDFEAEVEGGTRYRVLVREPQRSVAIAYDTSPSLAYFSSIIRHAMAGFAAGVVPGREFANFMNFASPFILKEWSDQPWVLEGAVLAKPGSDQNDSSDLETTLALISKAFEVRRGVRAAILVTDAETPGFEAQPDVWAALGRLRPRIFAAHIGAGNDPYREKQLMQDLASINGGFYASARTQAEMDVVADRAAAWLRRPARYQLIATARNEVPPLPGTLRVVFAEPPDDPANTTRLLPVNGAVELIVDASGSMLQRLNGERRIATARKVLSSLVTETLALGQPLAMRVFGTDRPDSCETALVTPLGPLDPSALLAQIAAITPVNLARTPIAASLNAVPVDLAETTGLRTIILVTDGEETCGGDPGAEIAALRGKGFEVRVNIVGFAIDDASLKQTFADWAQVGGGSYYDAGDAEELSVALRAAVAPPFRVLDGDGTIVASGTVGGPELTLPAARYRIVIGSAEPATINEVTVTPNQQTVVTHEDR